MRKQHRAEMIIIVTIVLIFALVTGYMTFLNGRFIYISTGMKSDQFLKINNNVVGFTEAQLLISDAKTQYEKLFGEDIWRERVGEVSFDDYVKEQVKSKLSRITCMNIYAKEHGTVLSRNQREAVNNASEYFYTNISDELKSELNITKDNVYNMFYSFAIAECLYEDIISMDDSEVSYDDSRVIQIQYIYSESLDEINACMDRIKNNDVFYVVARDIGLTDYERECRKGELDERVEEVAFELSSGEVSDIIELDGRYYIIKCISDNDKSKTEANKASMEQKLKLDYFNSIFEEYESRIYVEVNNREWDKLKVIACAKLDISFEDVYNKFLK